MRRCATATQLASGLIAGLLAEHARGHDLARSTPNLRPEGRQGPLVRTLASHLAYYERWAKTWEFQALLKARPVAGDLALGQEYVDAIAPLVWQAAQRDELRGRRPGHAPPGRGHAARRARPTARSSSAPAACATSSSRSSCSSSCTAAADDIAAQRRHAAPR